MRHRSQGQVRGIAAQDRLAIGIILFFDHAGKIKLNDDPTPFEVQMRLYERDVNDTLMINAGRKGEEADVDS